jgi:hypothetical protein
MWTKILLSKYACGNEERWVNINILTMDINFLGNFGYIHPFGGLSLNERP